jgi:hypothetical protein
MAKINVKDTEITIISVEERDYISLTDMANAKESESRAADIIKNWIRTRYTLEFLGTWEQINNPNFKVVEFDHFKMQAGLPSFVLSVSEWIEKTNAIGIIVRKGKYGGTYAHKDIVRHFAKPQNVQVNARSARIYLNGRGLSKCAKMLRFARTSQNIVFTTMLHTA